MGSGRGRHSERGGREASGGGRAAPDRRRLMGRPERGSTGGGRGAAPRRRRQHNKGRGAPAPNGIRRATASGTGRLRALAARGASRSPPHPRRRSRRPGAVPARWCSVRSRSAAWPCPAARRDAGERSAAAPRDALGGTGTAGPCGMRRARRAVCINTRFHTPPANQPPGPSHSAHLGGRDGGSSQSPASAPTWVRDASGAASQWNGRSSVRLSAFRWEAFLAERREPSVPANGRAPSAGRRGRSVGRGAGRLSCQSK